MDAGEIVFRGTPDELTARGEGSRRGGRCPAGARVQRGAVGGPVMSVMSMPAWPRPARALRLEFKRNAVPYVLPLLAAVFYFDTLRTADGFAPIWTLRASVIGDHMLFEFSAFAGGLAAWAGSREGRRKTVDLVAATPRAAWARRGTALAGTLCWMLLAFLAGVGRPVYPDRRAGDLGRAAAVAGVRRRVRRDRRDRDRVHLRSALPGAVHRAAGRDRRARRLPDRAPPGAGRHGLLGYLCAAVAGQRPAGRRYGRLLSRRAGPVDRAGHVHGRDRGRAVRRARPGAGTCGLAPARAALAGSGGWLLRTVAVVLVACGVAASWTAFALAGTAKPDAVGGWEIPALHSAASDQTGTCRPGNARPRPGSRCASTQRSASICTTWPRRSSRWPPRSRACPARPPAPGRWPA